MAKLLCESNINFTASSWKTIDATSFLNSEAASGNTTTSFVSSSTFTPGAITVEGIILKYRYVITNSGTLSVRLYNSTAAAAVASTTVTINVSDLSMQSLSGAFNSGGFIYFKFSAPVTLLGATLYTVQVSSSVNGTVAINSSSGTNWSRGLVTSTTAAPSVGDNLYLAAPFTTTSTPSFITCTMNNTSLTVFGSVELGGFSKMILENSASTDYVLKIGDAGKYLCTLNSESEFGTSLSRVKSNSSILIELQATSAASNGLEVRSPAKFTMYGKSVTRKAKLAANSSVGATSLTTDVSTGWLNGDLIAFGNTNRGSGTTQIEKKALSADASGTTLSIAAMTLAKSGTGYLVCDIANLTSNAKIYGTSTTSTYYILTGVSSVVGGKPTLDMYDVEFRYMGSNTGNKNGISMYGTTGSVHKIINCAFNDLHASAQAIRCNSANIDNINCQHNVIYGGTYGIYFGYLSIAGTKIISYNLVMGTSSYSYFFGNNSALGNEVSEIKYNISTGNVYGYYINATDQNSVFTNNLSYGNSSYNYLGTLIRTTVKNLDGLISNYQGSGFIGYDSIWDGGTMRGNQYAQIGDGGSNFIHKNLSIQSLVAGSDNAISSGAASKGMYYFNCNIGDIVQNAKTVEPLTGIFEIILVNCTLNLSEYPASMGATLTANSNKVAYQKINGIAGNNKTYKQSGTLINDTVIYNSSPSSLRLTPALSSVKLISTPFQIAVASGTIATISIKVRKSVVGDGTAYNGNQPRLILKTNPSAGSTYNSDIVCATATNAANGAWETLSYTLPVAVTDNTGMEFYIDCDGTTGWVNIDTFTSNNNNSIKYFLNGEPILDAVSNEKSFTFVG